MFGQPVAGIAQPLGGLRQRDKFPPRSRRDCRQPARGIDREQRVLPWVGFLPCPGVRAILNDCCLLRGCRKTVGQNARCHDGSPITFRVEGISPNVGMRGNQRQPPAPHRHDRRLTRGPDGHNELAWPRMQRNAPKNAMHNDSATIPRRCRAGPRARKHQPDRTIGERIGRERRQGHGSP